MTTLSDAILALGPTGYWPLNDTSGSTAVSAVGVNGSYLASPTLNQAALLAGSGPCVDLNGTTQYVSITDSTQRTAGAWTVCAAVKADTLQGYFVNSVSGGGLVSFALGIGGSAGSGTKLWAGYYDGTWREVNDPGAMTTGTAYYVAATWDGVTLALYRDGTQVATATPGGSGALTSSSIVYVGRRYDAGASPQYMDGKVSDVAIFHRAIPAADMANLAAAATGTVLPAFTGWVYKGRDSAADDTTGAV